MNNPIAKLIASLERRLKVMQDEDNKRQRETTRTIYQPGWVPPLPYSQVDEQEQRRRDRSFETGLKRIQKKIALKARLKQLKRR